MFNRCSGILIALTSYSTLVSAVGICAAIQLPETIDRELPQNLEGTNEYPLIFWSIIMDMSDLNKFIHDLDMT